MEENTPKPLNPNEQVADKKPTPPGALPPAARTRRKHPVLRWTVRLVLLLIVLVVLLVVFAPTIASTSAARSFVVGKINDNLNGRVQIADWSIGWTSGIHVSDVKVYDDRDRLILEVGKLDTPLSLIGAIKGNLDCGNTSVDHLNLVACEVYEDGTTNLQKLAKPSAGTQPAKPSTPNEKTKTAGKLPDIKGNFKITDLQGTVTLVSAQNPQTIHIDPSNIAVDVPNINETIKDAIDLNYHIGNGEKGSIQLAGTVDAIQNNVVDEKNLKADQTLELKNAQLDALNALLRTQHIELVVGGTAGGKLALKAAGMQDFSADGNIQVAGLSAGGGVLKGDTFKTKLLQLPIKASLKPMDPKHQMLNADCSILIDQGKTEPGKIVLTVNGPLQGLQEAAAKIAASFGPAEKAVAVTFGEGQAALKVDLDAADIAGQLPHMVALAEGLKLNSGRLLHNTTIDLKQTNAILASDTHLKDVAGVSPRGAVKLEPIDITASATAIGGQQVDLKDIGLKFTSGFASAGGGGKSLADLAIAGDFDLKKLQHQAEQFVDLDELIKGKPDTTKPATQPAEKVDLAGTGTFNLTTSGDLRKVGGTIATTAALALHDMKVVGVMSGPPIDQPNLQLKYSGELVRAAAHFASAVRNAALQLTSGPEGSPTLNVIANGDADWSNTLAAKFNVAVAAPNLPQVQKEYGPFIPALAQNKLKIVGGDLTVRLVGTMQNNQIVLDQQAKVLSIGNLSIVKNRDDGSGAVVLKNETIGVDVLGTLSTGGGFGAKLTQLAITTSSGLFNLHKSDAPFDIALGTKSISGGGTLLLNANVKQVLELVQAFSAQPLAAGAAPGQDLKSGMLDGSVDFKRGDKPATTVKADFDLTNVVLAQHPNPQKLHLIANADVPDDMTQALTASANVASEFANADVKNATVILQDKAGKPMGTLAMVKNADVTANVPDLPRLYALLQAFSPPAPQPVATAGDDPNAPKPLPPLQITSGSAQVAMNVKADEKDANKLNLDVSRIEVSKLALARGEGAWNTEQVLMAMKAAVTGKNDEKGVQQIDGLAIDTLTGNLGIAQLSMPQGKPIHISGLSDTKNLKANGTIQLAGTLDQAGGLIDALQGQKPGTFAYRGGYNLTQDLGTAGNSISLAGAITIDKFQVIQDGKPAFEEPQVAIRNAVDVDTNAANATIKQLSIDMPSSKALYVSVAGRIIDWNNARILTGIGDKAQQGMQVSLAYDMEKLWPIIHPLIAPKAEPGKPAPEDKLKDLKIVGKYQRTIHLRGSFPATDKDKHPLKFYQAIQYLQGDGGFAFDSLDIPGYGVTVQKFDLPFGFNKGVVDIAYADKPGQVVPPAIFNEGTLDLSAISVDLGQEHPRLTTRKDFQILKDVTLNPVFANSFLGKFLNNPLFADPKKARGAISMTLLQCDKLPIDEYAKNPNSDGYLHAKYSVIGLEMGYSPLTKAIAMLAPNAFNQDTLQGNIKDAEVVIEKGVVTTTNFNLQLDNYALALNGTVDMNSQKLNMDLGVPTSIIARLAGIKNIDKLVPSLVLPVRGTTNKPEIPADKIITQTAAKAAERGILGNLPGVSDNTPDNKNPGATSQSADQGLPGIIGDLLNKPEKPKDPDKTKKKKKP